MVAVMSLSAVILELKKRKYVTASTFSLSVCHEVQGPDAVIFVSWMLSFKPSFSLSSFTLIKRLFSFSSLSAVGVVSSAYLRLLIFLLAILIAAFDSSGLPFHMVYSAYKLNKQDEICSLVILLSPFWTSQLFHVLFCCFLTHIQVSWKIGKVVLYSWYRSTRILYSYI